MCDCYEFNVLISDLPEVFSCCGNTIYRGRNHIKVIDVSGIEEIGLTEVVVKQFHRPNVFQRIDYSFIRKSKAERAYRNANRLRRRGIGTPENLGYVEEWKHGIYQRSYYLTAYDEGVRLSELQEEKLQLIHEFAYFVARMHESGLVHRDLNPSNILCHWNKTDKNYEFSLVDINRMKLYSKKPNIKQCMKDLMTFSAQQEVYEYFVKQYLHARQMRTEHTLQQILRAKQKRSKKRHSIKKFFKRFDDIYYKILG